VRGVNASEPFGCPGSGGGDLKESGSECRYGGGSTRLYCQTVFAYGVPPSVVAADGDAVGLGELIGADDGEAVGVVVAVDVTVAVGDATAVGFVSGRDRV
jgi:hypothetical protein